MKTWFGLLLAAGLCAGAPAWAQDDVTEIEGTMFVDGNYADYYDHRFPSPSLPSVIRCLERPKTRTNCLLRLAADGSGAVALRTDLRFLEHQDLLRRAGITRAPFETEADYGEAMNSLVWQVLDLHRRGASPRNALAPIRGLRGLPESPSNYDPRRGPAARVRAYMAVFDAMDADETPPEVRPRIQAIIPAVLEAWKAELPALAGRLDSNWYQREYDEHLTYWARAATTTSRPPPYYAQPYVAEREGRWEDAFAYWIHAPPGNLNQVLWSAVKAGEKDVSLTWAHRLEAQEFPPGSDVPAASPEAIVSAYLAFEPTAALPLAERLDAGARRSRNEEAVEYAWRAWTQVGRPDRAKALLDDTLAFARSPAAPPSYGRRLRDTLWWAGRVDDWLAYRPQSLARSLVRDDVAGLGPDHPVVARELAALPPQERAQVLLDCLGRSSDEIHQRCLALLDPQQVTADDLVELGDGSFEVALLPGSDVGRDDSLRDAIALWRLGLARDPAAAKRTIAPSFLIDLAVRQLQDTGELPDE